MFYSRAHVRYVGNIWHSILIGYSHQDTLIKMLSSGETLSQHPQLVHAVDVCTNYKTMSPYSFDRRYNSSTVQMNPSRPCLFMRRLKNRLVQAKKTIHVKLATWIMYAAYKVEICHNYVDSLSCHHWVFREESN